MGDPIKYMSLALELLQLFQQELLDLFRKSPTSAIQEFKQAFDVQMKKITNTEMLKSIEDNKISDALRPMTQFLQQTVRTRNTSHTQRHHVRNFITRDTERMRMTGKFTATDRKKNNLSEVQELVRSFKVSDRPSPKTRMKWRLALGQSLDLSSPRNQITSENNLEILNQTLPEMEKRIKRLSFQDMSKGIHREICMPQSPRILETKHRNIHKFIPRLL